MGPTVTTLQIGTLRLGAHCNTAGSVRARFRGWDSWAWWSWDAGRMSLGWAWGVDAKVSKCRVRGAGCAQTGRPVPQIGNQRPTDHTLFTGSSGHSGPDPRLGSGQRGPHPGCRQPLLRSFSGITLKATPQHFRIGLPASSRFQGPSRPAPAPTPSKLRADLRHDQPATQPTQRALRRVRGRGRRDVTTPGQ